jgi:hypothetical protein
MRAIVTPHFDIALDADGTLVYVQIEKGLYADAATGTFPDEEFG